MFYVDLSQNHPGDLPKVCFVVPVDPTPAPGKLCLVAFDPVVRVLSSENSKLTMGSRTDRADCTVLPVLPYLI